MIKENMKRRFEEWVASHSGIESWDEFGTENSYGISKDVWHTLPYYEVSRIIFKRVSGTAPIGDSIFIFFCSVAKGDPVATYLWERDLMPVYNGEWMLCDKNGNIVKEEKIWTR